MKPYIHWFPIMTGSTDSRCSWQMSLVNWTVKLS